MSRGYAKDGPSGLLSYVTRYATVHVGMRSLLALSFICLCVTAVALLALGVTS
ncbi:MAG TPA: hypothetical protein VE615_06385 [Gaiellaceae bacterium]|nr:hypothetical protein [Gaiellaceae bacterium]